MGKKNEVTRRYVLRIKEDGFYHKKCDCKSLKELMNTLQNEIVLSNQDVDNFYMDLKIQIEDYE